MWIECVKSEQTKTEWKACKQQWIGLKHKSDTFCTFFSASSSPGRVLLVKKAAASLITRNIFYSFHFTDSEALCNKFPSIYFYILLSFCTMSIIDFYVFFLVFAGCFCGSLFMLWEKIMRRSWPTSGLKDLCVGNGFACKGRHGKSIDWCWQHFMAHFCGSTWWI